MCGFPLVQLDKYLKVLVQQNHRFVAMCEEFPRFIPGAAKPEFDRRVVRVITPGTLIDEPFLNHYENNYLLSISSLDAASSHKSGAEEIPKVIGLAWMDVSTGEFIVKRSTYDCLRDELARIGPKEIVLDKAVEPHPSHPIRLALSEEGNFVSYITPSEETVPPPNHVYTVDHTASIDGENTLTRSIAALTLHETSAIDLLTTFLNANLLEHMPVLSLPNREDTGGRMQIDSHTIRALEIRGGAAEGTTKGSLLSVIKRTVTSGGTRLLARWLCECLCLIANLIIDLRFPGSPSTSIKEISARQSLVGFLHARPHLRDDIRQALGGMEDASRIVQKFIMGRGNTSDLSAMHSTIMIWSSVKRRIEIERKMEKEEKCSTSEDEWASLDALMSRMSDLRSLACRISMALHQRVDVAEDTQTSQITSGDFCRPFIYGHGNWTIKPE